MTATAKAWWGVESPVIDPSECSAPAAVQLRTQQANPKGSSEALAGLRD